jgi:hypothetical protein
VNVCYHCLFEMKIVLVMSFLEIIVLLRRLLTSTFSQHAINDKFWWHEIRGEKRFWINFCQLKTWSFFFFFVSKDMQSYVINYIPTVQICRCHVTNRQFIMCGFHNSICDRYNIWTQPTTIYYIVQQNKQ